MPTYPLVYRIRNYLERQIAWSNEVLKELEDFCAAPEDAGTDFEAILEQQRRRESQTRSMAKEYHGLAREWAAATDIAPEDEAAIKRLSARARELADKLQDGYRRADESAAAKRNANQRAVSDLRRARRSVNIYRPGPPPNPGFVDKKA